MQGADVGAGDLLGRRDQLRCAPAQLRAVRRRIGGDVQAAGVRVERHGLDVTGELGRGCGEDVVELGEDAAGGGWYVSCAAAQHVDLLLRCEADLGDGAQCGADALQSRQ
ncbi:hypothetical protein G5C60_35965 [Streptomyces sp. HC44]|uniref:Uncharacterized protein n=1 Tax=Streptomyces scabichelini TaxID=2711217 RepID=A0A6G4VGB5_9ACTN|nr:hypothetical protein [Streptomyces scabichelini]NGO12860.1 hypothetical protein [Streptomyces scabichelini]